MPRWKKHSLDNHWRKRMAVDRSCISGIIGKPSPQKGDYEQLSHDVFKDHCVAYSAQEECPEFGGYRDQSNYYANERVVLTITDVTDAFFRTCFHWHRRRTCNIAHCDEHPSVEVSRYRKEIRWKQQVRKIKNLTWKK